MHVPHPVAMRRALTGMAVAAASVALTGVVSVNASTPGADVRVTNDQPGGTGYVSNYNINHPGSPVAKDDTLTACSTARGRQNEPAVAIDPRNGRVRIVARLPQPTSDASAAPTTKGILVFGGRAHGVTTDQIVSLGPRRAAAARVANVKPKGATSPDVYGGTTSPGAKHGR